MSDKNYMNDILSIVVAGIFSCIILDILGYLLKLIGIPEPMGNCRKMDLLYD